MQIYGKTLNNGRIFPIFYNFAVKINKDMKYYEVKFSIKAPEALLQDARDITSALAGEVGFETFEETEEGLTGYVQQTAFDQPALEAMLADFPLPSCSISFTVSEAEDRDWNEQWEQEGFEPICIDNQCVIHDGRHFNTIDINDFPIKIEIDAKLAFGTGTHETTRMMVAQLLNIDLIGKSVLDCGTGTGILAIAALKAGAAEAVGYDIDEWSADNARHNAVINQVDSRFTSLLGDATLLDGINRKFNVVLANINRNILLADMPRFAKVMMPHSTLILSGFYPSDIGLLTEKANSLGLSVDEKIQEGDWACLRLSN